MLKTITLLASMFVIGSTNAAIIDIDYLYDGSSFTSAHGNELIGTNLAVGDTLNLSYTALGANSYWDFSSIGREGNVNLGFDPASSCGRRSSHGSYSAFLDGNSVLSNNYSVPFQSCIHLGPNRINFSSVSMLDQFSISYVLDSSRARDNIIGSAANNTWWQIWELFDGGAAFTFLPDDTTDVAEPASIALFGFGAFALFVFRRKFTEKSSDSVNAG